MMLNMASSRVTGGGVNQATTDGSCVSSRFSARSMPKELVFIATMLLWGYSSALGQTPSTTTMNGTIQATTVTAGNVNNQAQVDGTTNPSLAAAVASPQCANTTSTTSNGCVIWDGFNEAPFQAWPFLGDHNYRLNMGHGNVGSATTGIWATTVPVVIANDQIVGSGRVNTAEDGSTGTVFRACDGQSPQCNGLYFPNAPPQPSPTWNAASGGSLSPGQYLLQIAWVVNLATGPDSKATKLWPTYISGTAIYPGYSVKDPSGTCGADGCTWMALNSGTAGSVSFSGLSKGSRKQDSAGITWYNVGFYDDSTSYGTPGLSLPSTEFPITISILSTSRTIMLSTPVTVPSYPPCTDSAPIGDGDYVTGPVGSNTNLYRAIGSGTLHLAPSHSCDTTSMSTTPGSQTLDQGATGTIYWQEVGLVGSPNNNGSNYLKIIGYIPYVSAKDDPRGSGSETARAATPLCSSIAQVGVLTYCPLNATFQVTSDGDLNSTAGGDYAPTIDTTHPLVVLGERQNVANTSLSTFMSRISDATLDAGNIAGEACLYVYAQEESGCYAVNALSGTEASVAAIGPGSQNSMLYDFQAGNPASGDKQQQRVAGVYLDGRKGEPMKTVLHGTITPYNSPTSSAVPAGLKYIGEAGTTIESVHTENVQDGVYCDGDLGSGTAATCNVLSTDAATGSGTENNTVRLGSNIKSAYVATVRAGSTHALMDDTSTAYIQDGVYVIGVKVGNFRTRLYPQATQGTPLSLVGPLSLASSSFAGAIGFTQGPDADASSGWLAHTATIEAPNSSFTSYRIQLPAGASAGIFEGSNDPIGSPAVVTGIFSGDSNHSKKTTGLSLATSGFLCSSGCLAGLYHIHWSLVQGAICTGSSSGTVIFQLSWTDNEGHSHLSQSLPMFEGSGLTVPAGVFHLRGALNDAWASGDINISTDGSSISYATVVAPCSSGTYDLYTTATQVQ